VTATPAVTAYSVATLNSDGSVLIDTLSVDAASGDTASVTVTGLTNGTSYTFKILARNADGNSDYSEISTAATPRTVADAPGIPTLVAADEQITATWTAPASNNGAEITGYTATASASGSSAGTCSTTSATDLDCAITSLTNGTAYEVTVTAANSAGNSNASAGASATPSTTPGTPTGVSGTSGDGQIAVSWSAPSSTGGSDITQYTATATPDGATCIATSGTTCTVTGLTNGTEYTFRVKATNANGAGSNSNASPGVTPLGTPGTATALSGTADAASVVLSWTAPTDTGGSAITDYTVEYSSDSGTTWSTFADGTSTTASARVTGLTNGTAYVFRVTTVNAQGSGSATSASSAVTPVTTPTAATLVAGTAGDTQVALTWTAPTDNGGSAVTDYTVEYSSDSGTTWTTFADGTSTTASATVTGLTNGTSYTFRVSPVNAQGTGTASTASAAVVPVTTPGAPTSVAATADGTSATVTWTAPSSTGGSAITGYKVESTVDAGTTWTTATANTASTAVTATYSDLTSGASYSFRVSAINAVGTGSASTASEAVQTGPSAGEVNAWLASDDAQNFLAILAFAGQEAADQAAAEAAEVEAWVDSAEGRRFLGLPTKAEEEAAAAWADSAEGRRFLGLPTKAEEEAAATAWLGTTEAANYLGVGPSTTEEWLATDNATTFLNAIAAAEEAAATAATQAWLATDEASRFLASLG
tara:strand:+ start:37957 stop:40077 length:2121 start_codon:yes stop_codon:yes gene_type:complete